jgi:hypothetical protein
VRALAVRWYVATGVAWAAVLAAHWWLAPDPRWLAVAHTVAFAVVVLARSIGLVVLSWLARRRPDLFADDDDPAGG